MISTNNWTRFFVHGANEKKAREGKASVNVPPESSPPVLGFVYMSIICTTLSKLCNFGAKMDRFTN